MCVFIAASLYRYTTFTTVVVQGADFTFKSGKQDFTKAENHALLASAGDGKAHVDAVYDNVRIANPVNQRPFFD